MAEFIKSWVMSLAGIIVFGSLCEMLLPSGIYKKYIHLAIGILLILTLLTPFTNKTELEFEIPDDIGRVSNSVPDIDARQNEDVISIYKQKLISAIEGELSAKAEVDCSISTDEESFGKINGIVIKTNVEIPSSELEEIEDKYGIDSDAIVIEKR